MTFTTSPSRFTLLALLLAVTSAACGGADEPADLADATDATATNDAAGAGDELFDSNFEQVCRETAQPRAAAYVAGPGTHPILLLQSDNGTDFITHSATLPEGWAATWPALERTELVGCIIQTSATPAQVCEGYQDEDSGMQWSVQPHNVTYDFTVRNARTAEVLGRSTFEVPAGDCPIFSMHSEGDPDPDPYYPNISDGEAEVFVRPFVTGS